MRPTLSALPVPEAAARAHSQRVTEAIAASIRAAGGWISFARYMQMALYAPGLGYYVAGARKFGADGDFVTAPEITGLFGSTLAAQVAAILAATTAREIIEPGAGTGRLAADLLRGLQAVDALPRRYLIVEVSPDLRERQRATLMKAVPAWADRIEWLDKLPSTIGGVVILNEVLDAIPPHVVLRRNGKWFERGVAIEDNVLTWRDGPLPSPVQALAAARFPPHGDYLSEVNPAAEALVEDIAVRLAEGAMLLLDYGFPRAEYYHVQRASGTLIAHYRHHVHAEPFLWPGLSDLTAHVDFTALAEAGERAGLRVAGFTSQAAFLLSCGLLEHLAGVGAPDTISYLREAAAVQTLTSPSEMGELFKVLALARTEGIAWRGFDLIDQSHRL